MPATPRRVTSTAAHDTTMKPAWERSRDIVCSALSRMERAVRPSGRANVPAARVRNGVTPSLEIGE